MERESARDHEAGAKRGRLAGRGREPEGQVREALKQELICVLRAWPLQRIM